jgi:hypothetical protein
MTPVSVLVPPDHQFAALLRRLDDLLMEAGYLREQINSAIQRTSTRPFWPDRRKRQEPYEGDRRSS